MLNQTFASTLYTARLFYVEHHMKKWKQENVQASIKQKSMQRKTYRKQWDQEKEKDPKYGEVFGTKSRIGGINNLVSPAVLSLDTL